MPGENDFATPLPRRPATITRVTSGSGDQRGHPPQRRHPGHRPRTGRDHHRVVAAPPGELRTAPRERLRRLAGSQPGADRLLDLPVRPAHLFAVPPQDRELVPHRPPAVRQALHAPVRRAAGDDRAREPAGPRLQRGWLGMGWELVELAGLPALLDEREMTNHNGTKVSARQIGRASCRERV